MPATAELPDSAPEAPRYRWVMLAACTLLIGIVAVVWHSFSVFLVALVDDFGWGRAEVSLGFSLFVICSGLTGPNAGHLITRYGARPVVIGGALVLAAGLAATSRMTALWQFYLFFGVITAVGFSAAGWVPVVTLLQTWFQRRLGAATGVASAGVGIGIMALVPAIQASILDAGWRTTYLVMAGAALLVIVPVALLIREGPLAGVRGVARATSAPAHDPHVLDQAWVSRDWSLAAAFRTGRYWYLLAAFFLASFASQQVLAHHVAYLRGTGFPALAAASIVGIVGVASIPAKITWGAASDRIGRELTYTFGIVLVVLALVVLWLVPAVDIGWLPYLYAVLIGAGYAVSATMPPIITADLFRGAAYGSIFGGIALASNVGSGAGTWLAGFIFDRTGSYELAFAIAIAGTVIGALCLWLAAPRKVRRAPGRARPLSERQAPRPAGAAPHRSAVPSPPPEADWGRGVTATFEMRYPSASLQREEVSGSGPTSQGQTSPRRRLRRSSAPRPGVRDCTSP